MCCINGFKLFLGQGCEQLTLFQLTRRKARRNEHGAPIGPFAEAAGHGFASLDLLKAHLGRLLKNSFPPQFDSVPDSVGFRCVHGFDPRLGGQPVTNVRNVGSRADGSARFRRALELLTGGWRPARPSSSGRVM
jgi:hypothetical protein